MKRFFMAALAVALLASSAMAANVASITEDFAISTAANSTLIYQNRTSIANHETPQAFNVGNGFKWGGWTNGPTNDNGGNFQVLIATQGTPTYPTAIRVLNIKPSAAAFAGAGAYAYTIFDSAGGNNPTSTVTNAASVTLVTPGANAAAEETSCEVGVLLRDEAGDWFKQTSAHQVVNISSGVENTFVITLAGKDFQKLTTAAADMNEMDSGTSATDYSPGALTTDGITTVAPTNVTGAGYYMNTVVSPVTGFKIRTFTVTGSLPLAPAELDVFQSDGTTAVANAGTIDLGTVSQNASMTGSLVLKNTGDMNLTLGTVSAVGATITDDPSAAVIAGTSQDTLGFSVNTGTVGPVSGSITIPSDDVDEGSYVVNFTGEVTALLPDVTVFDGATEIIDGAATAINIGSAEVGDPAPSKVFTINNPGGADLTVSVVAPAGFNVKTAPVSPVAASGNTTFEVELLTAAEGTPSGDVVITTNVAGDKASFTFAISGAVTPVTAARTWEQYQK